jgi:hypothetical protein
MKTGNEESKPIEGVEQITSQTIDLSSLTDQKVREIYKEELSKDIDNLHRYVALLHESCWKPDFPYPV